MTKIQQKVTPFLSFSTQAEEAAKIYTSIIPDSTKSGRVFATLLTRVKLNLAILEAAFRDGQ